MGKRKKVIPPQNHRICGTICICQMTLVLSLVALVYLTVAIYLPSIREFDSGISEIPVMCTTTRAVHHDYCDWSSCDEWCIKKKSVACTQIYVDLRNIGSSLAFSNCSNSANKTCYGIDQENAYKSNCVADECKNLTGTFNCSMGRCINITDAFDCVFQSTDSLLDCSGPRGKIICYDIDGLFSCNFGTCSKIKEPYNCDRRCVDIPTKNKNVVLLNGDKVLLSHCQSAYNIETQTEIWNESENNVLMASCFVTINSSIDFEAFDCVNGAVLDKIELEDLTNFTYLSYLHQAVAKPINRIAPLISDLTIANESKLMINLDGCVYTLRDECREFKRKFGKDGSDHNARARFPCFYSPDNTDIVVSKFDLDMTYKQFLFALVIPSILLIVSCTCLVLCQITVVIGDDAKMRFKRCTSSKPITVSESKQNNMGDIGDDTAM